MLLFLLILSSSTLPLSLVTGARKNVLFIGSDDLRPNLGFFQEVKVPTLELKFSINSFPVMQTLNLDFKNNHNKYGHESVTRLILAS